LSNAAKQLHQLLLRHVVEHILQVTAILTSSATSTALLWWIIKQFVNFATILVVLLVVWLLKPEEELSIRRFEFQKKNSTVLALIDALKLAIVREDD
jgi:hypothetical protein